MSCNTPSLSLSLNASNDGVLLTSSAKFKDDLTDLAIRYASQRRLASTVFEVGVEDFLENLENLSDWPSEDVAWSAPLEHLVRGNYEDTSELRRQLESIEPTAEIEWTPPVGWTAGLTPFQQRDIRRLLSLKHGANFSVPGAGKTRVALAVFATRAARGEVDRVLIVAPKSAYASWQDENLECFATPLRMRVLGENPVNCDALLVNYERLPQKAAQLAQWMAESKTMMIVDEGHRMKRGQAGAHGRTVLSLAPLARHRLILTGTPAPNGVVDLQNVMSFPWPGTGRAHVQRATASGDLRAASRELKPLFVRTMKWELGLPPYQPVRAPVELPLLHRRVYDALVGHFISDAPDLAELGRVVMYLLMAANCPALIPLGTTKYEPLNYMVPPLSPGSDPELRKLMRDLPNYEVSPKYLAATRIASDNVALGRKTIVWSTFVRSLASLELLLQPLNPAVVHGGTVDREDQLKRFIKDPDCHVLLSNPATLGEGINLHHVCNDAVYVDRDFAAGRYLQSLDRIHRLGLPPDAIVNVTVLVATGTIDEVVDQRLAVKLRFMGEVLDDPDVEQLADLNEDPEIAAGLSMEDARQVLDHLRHAAP